jgi:hypothetical protein
MSHSIILPHHQTIYEYFVRQGMDLYFSKPVLKHMVHFMDGVTQKGFSGTVTDIHALSHERRHRTTINNFLNKSPWDKKWIQQHTQQQTLQWIQREAKRTSLPIYVIIDDSLCEKVKPSSQAKSPIQGASHHFSHRKGKSIWGHQIVVMLLQCGSLCLPFAWGQYEKEKKSKIEMVCDFIESLPIFDHPAYVLTDSWYTSKQLINVSAVKGLYFIGNLKTNRILFPKGIHTAAAKLAQYISEADTHLVTVGNASYHVYRYEGALKEIENAVVLFCWPQGKVGEPSALRCFLSMDCSLKDETILDFYSGRWSIETFFQLMKDKMSLDRYRVRSPLAIDRFWSLLFLTYLYVVQHDGFSFFTGLRTVRKRQIHGVIEWVYLQSQYGVPLHKVQEILNIS